MKPPAQEKLGKDGGSQQTFRVLSLNLDPVASVWKIRFMWSSANKND